MKDLKGTVQALLTHGADINAVNFYGYSGLHFAARSQDSQLLQALINNGADIRRQANVGSTPIEEAAQFSNSEIVKILLEKARVDGKPFALEGAVASLSGRYKD
jgi:ankyrin repeat protein